MVITEETNARKEKLGVDEMLLLIEQVTEIYVAKGKKVIHFYLKKELPDTATLTKLLIGPTGNLRAPTLRRGKVLLVGFNDETYQKVLG